MKETNESSFLLKDSTAKLEKFFSFLFRQLLLKKNENSIEHVLKQKRFLGNFLGK